MSSDAPPVAARALVKKYGELAAVDGVDLTVDRGDVFGYLGPNEMSVASSASTGVDAPCA